MTTTLVLLRHGETQWSAENRMTSRTDIPLSPRGLEQAQVLGAGLAGRRLDAVLSSPMIRASTTADIIVAARREPMAITVDDRLRELDHGPFEGRRDDDYSGEAGRLFAAWRQVRDPVHSPEVEDPEAGARRALDAIAAAGAGLVLVVAHGYLIRSVTAVLLGMPATSLRRLTLGAASANVLTDVEGAWRLTASNVRGKWLPELL